jgi:hypothetical protein
LKQISSSSKRKKKLADDDPYDIYTIHSRKIQKAVQDNRVNVSEILEPISAAVRNVTNNGNSKEELKRKYDAFSDSVSQLLKSYGIYSMDISIFNAMHFLPTRLEMTQDGIYKNEDDKSVKIENILEVMSQLDPVELILLNLIDKIIDEVDSNHKKIEEIDSAIEWIKGIAGPKVTLPRKKHKRTD